MTLSELTEFLDLKLEPYQNPLILLWAIIVLLIIIILLLIFNKNKK